MEEVEEGGTLPATAATATVADRTHNHYHMEANGRSWRSSRRGDIRSYMRDRGVLGLLNRERDRELDRNMVDRQAADRERDRELDRNMMDREIAKQRDHELLALLDRERDRDRGGRDLIELLGRELERRWNLRRETSAIHRSKEGFRASDSEDREGPEAEVEALRSDFKKLMKVTSKTRGSIETKTTNRGASPVSNLVSQPPGCLKPSADIKFVHGRTIDRKDDDDDKDDNDVISSLQNVLGDG